MPDALGACDADGEPDQAHDGGGGMAHVFASPAADETAVNIFADEGDGDAVSMPSLLEEEPDGNNPLPQGARVTPVLLSATPFVGGQSGGTLIICGRCGGATWRLSKAVSLAWVSADVEQLPTKGTQSASS